MELNSKFQCLKNSQDESFPCLVNQTHLIFDDGNGNLSQTPLTDLWADMLVDTMESIIQEINSKSVNMVEKPEEL